MPNTIQVCGGPRAGPHGLPPPIWAPCSAGPHGCLTAGRLPLAQRALPHEALSARTGRTESGQPPLPFQRLLGWLADLLREVERLGKWLTRLAEGYTALIPKEGPPGPLNTRPLTRLSMVYRLWAAVRLADGFAWQESWAQPAAFGFCLAKSALDGAAVTQVLLELCRLRGWAFVGMSIDYVKCFDLIPQVIVLAWRGSSA